MLFARYLSTLTDNLSLLLPYIANGQKQRVQKLMKNTEFDFAALKSLGGDAAAQKAVAAWMSEKKDYNYGSNSCSRVCGHYTQVRQNMALVFYYVSN